MDTKFSTIFFSYSSIGLSSNLSFSASSSAQTWKNTFLDTLDSTACLSLDVAKSLALQMYSYLGNPSRTHKQSHMGLISMH